MRETIAICVMATLLLPANIEAYFCSEDIVVLSEQLISRLCGRGF